MCVIFHRFLTNCNFKKEKLSLIGSNMTRSYYICTILGMHMLTFLSLAICSISSKVTKESFPRVWSFSKYPRWQSEAKIEYKTISRGSKLKLISSLYLQQLEERTYSPTSIDIVFSASSSSGLLNQWNSAWDDNSHQTLKKPRHFCKNASSERLLDRHHRHLEFPRICKSADRWLKVLKSSSVNFRCFGFHLQMNHYFTQTALVQ